MPITYEARGEVCGSCGHAHRTIRAAWRCALGHGRAVRRANPVTYPTCAYSDRYVCRVDGEPLTRAEGYTLARIQEEEGER